MMSKTNEAYCEALRLVPVEWRGEFTRFLEEGEAGPAFLAFLEESEDCRRACEMVLRADETGALLAACRPALRPGEGRR